MNSGCEAIRNMLPGVLLGEAGPLDAARVGDHITGCMECREESGRLSDLLRSLGTAEMADPGAGYWESFLPRLRNRIEEEGISPAAPGSWLQAWAAAAAVLVLLLGAAVAMTLRPSAENSRLMAIEYLAARTDPETLRQTLDLVLPGSDIFLPDHSAGTLSVPHAAELQRALDTLLPGGDADPYSAANDLPPEARRWLLKTLMPDRV